jgi:hypothetical protein
MNTKRIQHPGSRGGHGYYDDRGEWQYGEPSHDQPIHHEYIERLTGMGYHVIDHTEGLDEDEKERTFRSVLKACKRLTETHPGIASLLSNHHLTLDVHSALDPLTPRVDYDFKKGPRGTYIDHITVGDGQHVPLFQAIGEFYKFAKRQDNYEANKERDEATQDLLGRMMGGRGKAVPIEDLKQQAYDIWAATPRGVNETINKEQAAKLRELDKLLVQINEALPAGEKPVTLGTLIREKLGKSFRYYMFFGHTD